MREISQRESILIYATRLDKWKFIEPNNLRTEL